uniref:Uncharacterized protein n=1 Tax=Oryza sativa subsp. japonica TaxID=39947 RepID=Q6H6Z6_ORYSJ|nr:hypothetical protein [Oryza sativa Japonica Group]
MEAKIGATAMVLLLLAFGVVGEAKTHEYRSHTFKGVCIHDDLWKYCVRVRSRYDGSSPNRNVIVFCFNRYITFCFREDMLPFFTNNMVNVLMNGLAFSSNGYIVDH